MYQVRYLNNDGWGDWEPISDNKIRSKLADWYKDVSLCLDQMERGEFVRTSFAEYRHTGANVNHLGEN